MAKKPKERRFICTDHDEIKELAQLIMGEFDIYQTPRELKRNIRKHAKEIVRIVADAKESGIKMEERLYEYKDAISSLGYERKKTVNRYR